MHQIIHLKIKFLFTLYTETRVSIDANICPYILNYISKSISEAT